MMSHNLGSKPLCEGVPRPRLCLEDFDWRICLEDFAKLGLCSKAKGVTKRLLYVPLLNKPGTLFSDAESCLW